MRLEEELQTSFPFLEPMRSSPETRAVEEKPGSSSQYVRSLLEANLDPLVTISVAGKVTDVNRATEDVTGLARAALIGTDFCSYFTEPDRARSVYREVFAKDEVKDYRLAIRSTTGAVTDVLYNASLYRDENGAVAGVFAAARNVTTLKKAERALLKQRRYSKKTSDDSIDDLAEANALLRIANREWEALFQSVARDLQAPLQAVGSFLHILPDECEAGLDPEGVRALGAVYQGVDTMARLIDDILTFTPLGPDKTAVAEIDSNVLVQDVLNGLVTGYPGHWLTVDVEILPPSCCDAAGLRRVWFSLIANAIKFSASRPEAHIQIGATREDNEVIYFVRDNGIGFDTIFADRVFRVFERLHGAEEFGGRGIGLAIVSRVVRRHGGRVWAEGKVNEGATFYFSLPGKERRRSSDY